MIELHAPWKFTPSPEDNTSPVIYIVDDLDFVVCEVAPFEDDWGPDDIARLHLISAAPELLEACKVVTTFLDKLDQVREDDPLRAIRLKVHAPLRAALNPAIAKAEGRS